MIKSNSIIHSISLDKINKILPLLLITDLLFILIHIAYKLKFISGDLFSIEEDFGYAEVYQYIKEFWIVILLSSLVIKTKEIIYLSWSFLFFYLLLDDSLQIHEIFGSHLVSYLEIQSKFNLRAQDFGELMISAIFGSLLFSFIGLSYFRSNKKRKIISKNILIMVTLLAFFGVFIDMLHSVISWGTAIWGLIEDSGEMFIMSIIVWYVFGLKEASPNSDFTARYVQNNMKLIEPDH